MTFTPPKPWYLRRPLVCLAPMEAVTDAPFRRTVRQTHPEIVLFTPFIAAEGLIRDIPPVWRQGRFTEDERPLVIQLFGRNPDSLARATEMITERLRPDGIDFNCGCPTKKVVKSQSGAVLLREPDHAAACVRAMRQVTDLPLSVKTRLGWINRDEVFPFAEAVVDAGADALIIHGRLADADYYSLREPADWEGIARVVKAVKVPVIANGAIRSPEDALLCLEVTSAAGIMIGTGIFQDPWLPARCLAALKSGVVPPLTTARARLEMALQHLEFVLSDLSVPELPGGWGEKDVAESQRCQAASHPLPCVLYEGGERGEGVARASRSAVIHLLKYLPWYTRGLPGNALFRQRASALRSADEMRALLLNYVQKTAYRDVPLAEETE